MTRRGATLTFTDDDYFNPWLASRWLAFWVDLMLQERMETWIWRFVCTTGHRASA